MRFKALFTSFHFLFLVGLLIVGCGGSSDSETDTEAATTYTIGGTLSGLTGTVVLQNNDGDDLTLTADGSFTFDVALEDGETYQITVATQPDGLTCSVSNGAGTVDGADVTDVSIVCSADTYTVGGTVTGLSGTVVLQNNSANDLTITADGSFAFTTAVADGAGYLVAVTTQPSGLTCSASNNSGTMSGANVTNVAIVCSTNTYTVGGTISGLSGTVVLQNNAGDNLSRTANDSFTFSTAVADGATYAVTIKTQPSTQTCTASSNAGTISGANVTNVSVTCSTNTYTVGGTIAGLAGRTVVLQNNTGNDLTTTANGAFTFTTVVADGANYAVTVKTEPSGGSCSIASGTGTISGANVTNVAVVCIANNKIVFVASSESVGNLGGLSGADASCNQLATAAGLTGTFSAWLSTTSVNAKDRVSIGHAGGFVLRNGTTTVADNFADLLDATIDAAINQDESGNTLATNTWTGTAEDGTAHANTCSDWTSSSGLVSGRLAIAQAGFTDAQWTNFANNGCSSATHWYCFQD
ncbi:MAG: DUF1554 domain-containing protein [Deltaproteobacteria bacterium]|nr:DUF1554 domain-containing protein [Deltaproteobacteria bacterium]